MKKLPLYLLVLGALLLVPACENKTSETQTEKTKTEDSVKTEDASEKESKDSEELEVSDYTKSKTYKFFKENLSGEEMYMKQKIKVDMPEGASEEGTAEFYKKGENLYSVSELAGAKQAVLLKDKVAYLIMIDQKSYMKIPSSDTEGMLDLENMRLDDIDYLKDYQITTGKEEVSGKSYSFEQFSKDGMKMTYYFNGGDLKFVKGEMLEGYSSLSEILEYSNKVDDSVFEIPADYTEIGEIPSN